MDKNTWLQYKIFAKKIQIETIKCIASIGVGHVGGALSLADLLSVLYGGQLCHDPGNPKWGMRDWLVCSKGHAGPAVYAALALRGFFPMSELLTLNKIGTNLPSHCDRNKTVGIDMTTGSLGQGASSAAGIALGHKMNRADTRVFLIMGDGELQEGQVWEMAAFASQQKLSNLIAFIDNNHLQIDGFTDDICSIGNSADRFRSFGWYALDADGHDPAAIHGAIEIAKTMTDKPSVIVLDTIKGEGWSRIANTLESHSKTISGEERSAVIEEMGQALREMEREKRRPGQDAR